MVPLPLAAAEELFASAPTPPPTLEKESPEQLKISTMILLLLP